MARSLTPFRASVSVEELLAGSGSFQPAGTVMVAVLARGPVAPAATVAVAVKVAVPFSSRLTVALMLPLPLGAPHDEPALAVQVQVAPVSWGGNVSATAAPTTCSGPRLLATMV